MTTKTPKRQKNVCQKKPNQPASQPASQANYKAQERNKHKNGPIIRMVYTTNIIKDIFIPLVVTRRRRHQIVATPHIKKYNNNNSSSSSSIMTWSCHGDSNSDFDSRTFVEFLDCVYKYIG